ncbi:MAG TPA: LA2681 family HEPN domain-containing protein [Chitinophagaceae bacterium]|nr:LA2681 family HEPN domain-containing protein [Chitinophagaceae bacterium]
MERLKIFSDKINSLLDGGKYLEAKKVLIKELENSNKDDSSYPLLFAEIAGFLIDIGSESLDKEATQLGLEMLEKNENFFKDFISEQSYNYCFANGKNAMYKIENKRNGLPSLESIMPFLSEAKNYYFKAFKVIDLNGINDIDLKILTNLANNLYESGRVIEAIRLYDSVLKINSKFPQALIGMARSIDHWIKISACPQSISLFVTIYNLYKEGLIHGVLPPEQKEDVERSFQFFENVLKERKFDFSTIEHEMQTNKIEYCNHSVFRKFCLDNFLTLNEHSLFCKCSGSSQDDLSIVHTGISLYGDKVGKMELLLNRIKSEFHLARKLYFESTEQNDEDAQEVLYSDLMEGEAIGTSVEKIRTSFRLCFGILDKIANGVCYFFDLPKRKHPKEYIYFQDFWKNQKCPERWELIKNVRNPHLVALFCIANDLNYSKGEFGFYKNWRNKLEHNNLIIIENEESLDILDIFKDNFVSKISLSIFEKEALHLLQICCATIYSYVYTIRTSSMSNADGKPTLPFIIQPKIK